MDESSSLRKKWFYIIFWIAILLLIYGWRIVRMGGIEASTPYLLLDLTCIFPALLIFWMAFFSQFVLPVRTFRDRQKIFGRLLIDLFGGHGPALFIENGEVKEHSGERLKKGPGVVWLDSASAAVTRTSVKIKQTIGPGVHFIGKGEYIAGTVDLHIQSQALGPKENDKPLEEKKEGQSEDDYNQIQDRRKQVSAWTRDGIEIIPTVTITFRVDTGVPKEGESGSRFGYRIGVTKKDKENEEKDNEAIRKAILGQGINLNALADSPRRRIAWNELPAALAVDVWREYAAKFTLNELFEQTQIVPPEPPTPPEPTQDELDPLNQPVQIGARSEATQNLFESILRELNRWIARVVEWLEENKKEGAKKPPAPEEPTSKLYEENEPKKKTALQVINDMVKARLTQPEVDLLDDNGRRGEGKINSKEFDLLQNRGLRVLNVSISNLRFDSRIDKEIIDHWEATWLINAKAEREQVERRRSILEAVGEAQAAQKYANFLSRGVMRERPKDIKSTLKTLLMRSRLLIIKNDQLRRLMGAERQEVEEILQWVEDNE